MIRFDHYLLCQARGLTARKTLTSPDSFRPYDQSILWFKKSNEDQVGRVWFLLSLRGFSLVGSNICERSCQPSAFGGHQYFVALKILIGKKLKLNSALPSSNKYQYVSQVTPNLRPARSKSLTKILQNQTHHLKSLASFLLIKDMYVIWYFSITKIFFHNAHKPFHSITIHDDYPRSLNGFVWMFNGEGELEMLTKFYFKIKPSKHFFFFFF